VSKNDTVFTGRVGAGELVTRSTHHTVKSCDELTIMSDGILLSLNSFTENSDKYSIFSKAFTETVVINLECSGYE